MQLLAGQLCAQIMLLLLQKAEGILGRQSMVFLLTKMKNAERGASCVRKLWAGRKYLVWEVLSLKACGTSSMRCPVRWRGEGSLAQGQFRMRKKGQHLRMKQRKGSVWKKVGKSREVRGELGEASVSEVKESVQGRRQLSRVTNTAERTSRKEGEKKSFDLSIVDSVE